MPRAIEAWHIELPNVGTAFTWAVLDALRNADTNRNGLIELSEVVGG